MWNSSLARHWRSYVPPCRPSRFDLELCSQLLQRYREGVHNRYPDVLVLGSTTEFRDWAFEERCRVTVIDKSRSFHRAISADRRYKNVTESVIFKSWEEMSFKDEFDLIVGDLIIGNIIPNCVNSVLERIHRALRPGGTFMTKSFFATKCAASEDIFAALGKIERQHPYEDPFPNMAYPLTIAAMDKETNMVEFEVMYKIVRQAYNKRYVTKTVLKRLDEMGWNEADKSMFYVMPLNLWEQCAQTVFQQIAKHQGPYSWSRDFPVFVMSKDFHPLRKENVTV